MKYLESMQCQINNDLNDNQRNAKKYVQYVHFQEMQKAQLTRFSSVVGIDCGENGFDTVTTNRSFAEAFKKLSQGKRLTEDQPILSSPRLLVVDVRPTSFCRCTI